MGGAASAAASFAPLSAAAAAAAGGKQFRRLLVPAHRYTPLRDQWMEIYTPIVEQMMLQIRFNPKRRSVEIKVR
jgi:RNA-binding protein PNO1